MLAVKIYSVGFLFVLAARGSFQNSVDYRGKEFVLSFSLQHPRHSFSGNNILYISSFEDGTVRVHVPSLTNFPEKSYALSAGGSTIVQLSGNTRTNGTSGLEKKKGIRITADKPMSVQGLANATHKVEGFLGLPVDALGMFYIAAAYHPVINAVIQVVAIEDNTTVTITLRTNGKVQYQDNWYGNGQIISETLNDLDVFQVLADQDLTGTIIRSSKPVAVFTGDDCTLVPVNKPPCNHLVEQIPPVSLWGKFFVTNPTPNSPGGDEFHIIASQNTAVYVDSQYKGILDQGEKYKIDVSWNKSSVISTTQPSLVMQYSKAGKSPSMNVVPPMESFTNDYTVYVPQDDQENTFDCYVNVIIDTASRSGLRVKGADSVVRNWTTVLGSGGFSRASIHLTSFGSYHVYHENPLSTFSAVFYGMNRNGMLFAMPAGMELPRQSLDDTCKPTNTVGGDNIDNDCDGLTDEELKNGVDDDSDGVVDEDLATPVPTLTTPKNFVTTLCNRSSDVFNTGTASGSAYGACLARGEAKISHMDNIVTNNTCGRITDRVWNITDSCGNSVTGIQRVTVYTPEEPTIVLPKDIVFTCREKKYLDPKFAGQVTVTNTNLCPRNVTITYVDRYKDDCLNSNREGRLERIWTVKDKCKGSQTKSQVIILVPKGLRRSANYVVSFKLTNEMFSAELQDMESPAFKSLSRGLEHELEKTFMESKSILGQFFVAATVLDFSNGSVIPRVLIKIDAQAQISQWQLVEFMNETLKSGMLGQYQVDPTSVELTDFDECQAPDLNNCHKKAKCTNTVGSYNCSCLKGFIGDGVHCRDSVDYRGKEFVLSFLPQHPRYLFSGNNILYISSFENGTVRVHVPSLTNFPEKSYALSAEGLTIVQLSGNTRTNSTSGLKKKRGIRITADKPMSVQGLANATQKVEGFLGLPVDALGMFYIAAAYRPVINAVIQVVAIEDNTTVTITLRTNGKVQYQDNWYGNGHIISETLNDLDVFQVLADQDLTGTIIRSTKPVAVFTGDDCTMVPENKLPCNHLVEQIPPVFLWGKVFVTNPTPNSPGGDEYHIIASQNTEVKVDSQYKVTLDQGEKYKIDVSWNKSSVISTTQPSLVMQYSKAGKSPSMNVVPPMQYFTNDYTVYVPQDDQGNTFDCYVNVVIDTASRSGLRVKGAGSIVKNWTTILGSGGFSRASIHLTSVGSHHVYHENPLTTFSAVFYGTNRNGLLFAMPAGMELQMQSLDDTCKPTNTVGGDNIDNDCDGLTDEELKNGVDDDSDGRVDEDLVTPVPTLTTPKHFVTTLCNRSSEVFNAGTARGSAHGVCKARGEAKISHIDNIVSNNTCGRITDRVWNITDSCGNFVTGIQRVTVYTPEEPTIVFAKDIVFTCREKKYLDPKFAGQVTVTSTNLCPRNVTITYVDRYKDDCLNSNRERRLERIWTVKDKCKGSQTKTQVIILVPKGLRRSANYVVSFKITNEMFSAELQDMESPSFKSLSRGLELELEKTFMESKSILGQYFVAATVLNFSNGSVIPRVLIKIDAQAQISQWQLVEFMNETLKSSMLGKYQVDPSSVELTDFDECQAPDLNNCHKKAKCTNTVGSYNCSCLKGFIGDGVLCRDSVDYRGKEFVLSFSPQHPRYLFSGNNILYISSFENGTVRVHVPSLTNSPEKSYALSAGDLTIVQLSSNTRTNSTSGLKKKKGIRITADKPMSVQGLANATQKVEGFLGVPVDALGMFYIAAAYRPVINAVIQVVAIEDNTTVTITLRTNGKVQYQDNWYGNGHTISETLNDLDVFQVLADQDLTGTIIRSTKPVAVFTGDDCTMVPENKPPCNHLVEQIPPVFLWGKVFVTNPTPNSPGGDEFHIIASQNTEVKVDSQYKVTLDQGEKYKIDVSWNKSSVISTTQPSLVMQYSKAGKSPSMNVVPPMESFTNDYTVYVPQDDQGNTFDCYVNVVIDTASRSGLRVKGAGSIVKNWTTILGSGGFSRASIHLTSVGSHHVYHENPLTTFSAVFYGTNRNGMLFAMPAGMELQLQSLQLQRQSLDDTCKPTNTVGGDNIDNDCDGLTDEELKNGVDDDSDGRVDEDLVTPVPTLITPKHFVTTLCNRSSDVFNAGTARGSAHGVCKARGEAKISYIDNIVSNNTCGRMTDRVWNITDSCGNSVTGIQRVTVYTPEEPTIVFPKDIVFTCREKKYLDPKFAGQVTVTSTNLCPRNVTITYVERYKDDCLNSNREGRLERIWTVKDKCKGSQTKTQVIILVPKGLRRSANYVVSFKITNEMFSAELQDMESPSFKSLSRGLELELEKTFMESKSILGQFFVAATVLNFSNGSVIPRVLIKIDAQAQISQWQLVEFMNETLKSGMLGKYQVDPSSVELTDFDECQAPDLNNCHKKAKCTNTVGSYNCSCLKGFIGDGVLCRDSVDYRGKEFVLSFSPQHPRYLFSGNNILYISSFENGTVRVHVPSLTNSPEKSYALSAGDLTIVQLSSNTRTNSTSGLKKKKGIRITADKPMSVQGLANATQKVEGFLGVPVDALGMFYIAAAYHPVINAVIQVVAIEDNTTVTITLRTNGKVQYQDNWYGNGHIISETLNDLDVFQVLADQDLTGTIIRSTKPVAVFTGDDCTMVPENKPPCNHLVEQIPPVFLWGKVFVTNPTPNSPGGDEFHIIASQNTEVKVDSQYKVTLDQGEKYMIDVSWNKSSVITTTQPSLVMQYSKAGKSPSMNVVPPMESSTNDYTVYVPQDEQGNTFDCYVNVVIDTASRSGLRVKGAGSIAKNWTTILGSGGFSRASIHLTSVGSHHVYHENPLTTFSAVFYGTNRNGMLFAMPAGMELQLQSLQLQRQSLDDTCKPTNTVGGDNIDNDCDGLTDEELKNGVDDDSDGRVDEDLVTPVPTLITPKHFVTTLCNRSSDVFNAGSARGSAHGVCKARGEAKISHIDNIVSNNTCRRITDRVWNITDSCGNSVTGIQRVTVYTPEEPTIVFPEDIVFTCREKKYLDPKFAGQVTVTSTNLCPRNVTITYVERYKDDCLNSNREGRLERIWTVKDKCKGSQTKSQVISLVPKGLRRSANYVVSFKITNEMFSAELQDMESPSFKSLSRGLELELEKTFMESKSILGQFFVAATVLNFSNGSVIPKVLIKIDAQAQISQWQLVEFMNETLKSSMLGKYQVDPTSVELTDFDECQAPDLNNCHKKAKCTNTVGSYNCSCLKGFIGDGVLCQDSVDYRGKEFVLSFSPQHPRHPFSGNNILYISSFEDGTVRVHVPSLTNFPEKSHALSAGGLTIVQLSGNTRTNGNSGLEKKKGIRITADKPMSVQGLANATQKVEGFLGLPVDALGMFYIAAAYHPVINAVIQVVATEDNTTVTIKLRTSGRVQYQDKWYGDGQVISETLNDLDVFQVLADQDLTGTIIRSTKPVAVFTGDDCTMVPENKPPCNHLVEQIPPVFLWGKVFVTNPTPNSPGGDEFHIIASQNTAVYVDSQYKVTLDQGEKYKIDVSWNKSSVISTTQPSLVIQYSKAGKSPSMNIVPPIQYFTNDYTVYVPQDDQGNTFDGYVNVVIDTASRSGLRVKGADSIVKNWTVIPGSGGFSRASIHLTSDGSYHVYHENPLTTFSAVFYGTNRNGMLFAMPAGMELQMQSLDDTCKLTNTVGGDNIDNDCDGLTDEELKNGVDDDSDGRVDEDLVTPVPTLTTPKHFVTTLCNRSSGVSNTGTASGSAHGVCRARGEAKILHLDNIVKNKECGRITDRVWIIRDSCGNSVTGIQRVTIDTPEEPTIVFPKDIVFTCREKKYLDPKFAGQVSLTSAKKLCPRNVTITYVDGYKDDCLNSNREGRLERIWTVKDKCKGSQTKSQVIILVPKGLRRSTNYVVSFKITNEMFSAELQDMESPTFKSLSRGLELELEKTFMGSKSILGQFFVAATVLDFSNGSIIPRVLIKIDAQTQISQRQLVEFMNETLKSGMLGKYQADPTSIESTDFDECQAPDLNNCHEKAKCINTVGSYNCSCLKGFVGDGVLCQAPPSISYIDPAMEIGTEENVTLACHAEGLPEPNITWVTPDEQLVTPASDILETSTLDDGSKYVRGKKMQQDGSLLIYNTRDNDGGIYKCIAENGVGRDVKSVNVTVRDDLVGVDAAITIEDQVFDQDLENKSSTRYQTLEQQVKQELTALFQDIEGFEEVIILGFVNGSVKVRFRVVVIVKPEEKKTTVVANKVGKTLSASVQTGQIGSLKVKKKVELRELPPPPENVRASDVERTEAVITWSHPELYQMYSINGYSLQIRQFGTNTWLHFTSTPGENHRITNLDPDTAYFVRLKSKNEYGMGEPSTNGELKTKKGKNVAELVLPIVISLLLIIILAIVVVIVYRRWKKKRQNSGYLNDGEQVPMNPVTLDTQNHSEAENGRFTTSTFGRDRYALVPGGEPNNTSTPIDIQASFSWREIPRDRIILGKILGEGEFGTVVKGELTEDDGNVITCAVKKLKRTATESDLKDLLNELEIMTSVGNHPNLVNLIGACSVAGPLLVVVEFAEHGNLLRHLRDRRKQNYDDMNEYTLEISFTERLRIACEVSDGMKHLAAMKCAHRDLAARNVLLGEGMVAKVSDFGLSRDIYTDNVYEKKTGGKLPAKWMAVESLEQGIYTSQSDVWSFGVLLWEIETGGCAPYAGVASSELLPKLKAGHRLDKPRYCTDWLYAIMLRCWNANPKARPKFEDLSDELHRMLNQQSDYLTPEDYKGESSYVNTSRENISA